MHRIRSFQTTALPTSTQTPSTLQLRHVAAVSRTKSNVSFCFRFCRQLRLWCDRCLVSFEAFPNRLCTTTTFKQTITTTCTRVSRPRHPATPSTRSSEAPSPSSLPPSTTTTEKTHPTLFLQPWRHFTSRDELLFSVFLSQLAQTGSLYPSCCPSEHKLEAYIALLSELMQTESLYCRCQKWYKLGVCIAAACVFGRHLRKHRTLVPVTRVVIRHMILSVVRSCLHHVNLKTKVYANVYTLLVFLIDSVILIIIFLNLLVHKTQSILWVFITFCIFVCLKKAGCLWNFAFCSS